MYSPGLNFSLEPRVCMCVCVYVQISSLKPLGQLKPNFTWNLHGIGEESLFKWSRSFVVLHYCQPPGEWAFSSDFTINLSPQCRAFSRALKIEKLKAPLFPGPVEAGTTNDWCIKVELNEDFFLIKLLLWNILFIILVHSVLICSSTENFIS